MEMTSFNTSNHFDFMTLFPPEVVEVIFQRLVVDDLPATRLVNKQWNNYGTYEFAKAIMFDITVLPFTERCNNNVCPQFEIDPRLINVIRVLRKPTVSSNKDCLMPRLVALAKKYGSLIKGIIFYQCCNTQQTDNAFCNLKHIHKILTNLCLNLQYFKLVQLNTVQNDIPTLAFQKQLALTHVELICIGNQMSDGFQNFLDDMLKESANLRELFICGELTPNLSSNKNLKKLFIKWLNPSDQFDDLCNMISQVANSLEVLKFDTDSFCPNDLKNQMFCKLKLPLLHRVKTIVVCRSVPLKISNDLNLSTMFLSLVHGMLQRCPNVKRFLIQTAFLETTTSTLSYFLEQNIQFGITNLELRLSNFNAILSFKEIYQVFPNLTQLKLGVNDISVLSSIDFCENFAKLRKFYILLLDSHKISNFATSLLWIFENKTSLLANIKYFTIDSEIGCKDDLTLSTALKFEKALLLSKNLKEFKLLNFQMVPFYCKKMTAFVKTNNLPVYFINGKRS